MLLLLLVTLSFIESWLYETHGPTVLHTLAHLLIVSFLDGSPGFYGPKSYSRWMTRGKLGESQGKAELQHLFEGEEEGRTKGLFLIRWLDIWRDWIPAQSTVIAFLPGSGTYGWVRQSFCVFPDPQTAGRTEGHTLWDWVVPSFSHSLIHWNGHLEKHCSIMERILLWIKILSLPHVSSVTLVKPFHFSEPQLGWIKVTSTHYCYSYPSPLDLGSSGSTK